ncbi:uncharacterized protein LOC125236173 [Leguminivora glycinivorella]|uniref:uncharacterized protein LOC125236173 n=1 Tax=Leguminivora glycinivorella TaxID=1035111 RepID=UPI00200C0379|nr:uncharacterized protein LOC125236173 [Leguminivora glycinivorella]
MGPKLYHVIFWLALLYTPNSSQDPDKELLLPRERPQRWRVKTTSSSTSEPLAKCKEMKPTPRDIVRRIYAILPYFDRGRQNVEFLQRYRVSINRLSESEDLVDREVSFYAAVLTPLVFLQRYKDAKCLLERFQQALESFDTYPAFDKRVALKNLQSLRELSHKILVFVSTLPDKRPPTRTPEPDSPDEEEYHMTKLTNKNDVRFLKELIKNLG